jgi:hypothetical protein
VPTPQLRFIVMALVSCSLIALEITWTRVFSAEYFYTFAFLILSLAILGLGLGGLALRLFPGLRRPDRIGLYLLVTAVLAAGGPPLVLHLGLDFQALFTSWAMAGRLALMLLVLGSAFCSGGMVVSLLFRTHHEDMPRLYMADLVGAGLGVAGVVLAMNLVGTPQATTLLLLPLALAAFLVGTKTLKLAALCVSAVGLALLPWSPRYVAKPRHELAPVVHRHWDATALIKVNQFEGGELNINIDNAANTPLVTFDGDWDAYRKQPSDALADPKPLMDTMAGSCRFLSIGAGGGFDVLLALRDEAAEVHAVEVNPYINRMLMKGGRYFETTGKLYQDPRVRVATEDARTYVRRFKDYFDVIFSHSSNSFAALASGAFAMTENYVFTTEAFRDYYRALSPRGYLIMEHQFYMPRVVSEALDGMRAAGVHDPERHIAVYAVPQERYVRNVLVMGKRPLAPEEIQRPFLNLDAKDPRIMHRVYPDPDPAADPTIARIVREGWRAVDQGSRTDLSPATDGRPFIAMQGRLRNVNPTTIKAMRALEIQGFPVAKFTVIAVLAIALALILPLNLLPYLRPGPRLRAQGWCYFFAIGFAFMALEVVLIQKYTRFIGASSYTVVAILFALLIGSGLGSRFAPHFGDRVPFLAIIGWLLLDAVFFGPVTDALVALPILLRMAAAVVLLAPLAFFMGMPFTKGTARVGACIDWGFAVNGAASVIGSACALLVSFQWGFAAALALAGLVYLLAMLQLMNRGPWVLDRGDADLP